MTPDGWTIAAILREGARRLAEAGIETPRLESRLLLAHALGWTPEALIRDLHAPADPGAFFGLVARRAGREPLALIVGWREFWSLRFKVSPATLIPRADSETVVEAALAACPAPGRVLDLGTGTGCLLLAVLSERPGALGVGVDLSDAAAVLARNNARSLRLGARALFVCGDWASAVEARFDLVLSNPPYIETAAVSGLMPEVAAHEPWRALDGGEDGLDAYRTIVAGLPRLLAPGGVAVLELGFGQFPAVAGLARGAGLAVEARADLSGTPRAMILRGSP